MLALRAIREDEVLGGNPALNTQTISSDHLDSLVQSGLSIVESVLLTVQKTFVLMRLLAVTISFDFRRRREARNFLARLSPFLDPLIIGGFPAEIQAIVPDTLDGFGFAFAKADSRKIAICRDQIRSRPVRLQHAEFTVGKLLKREIRVLGINEYRIREKRPASLGALRPDKSHRNNQCQS